LLISEAAWPPWLLIPKAGDLPRLLAFEAPDKVDSGANSGQMFSASFPEKFGSWRKNSAAHTLVYGGWFN
jgi:hypothetical protein